MGDFLGKDNTFDLAHVPALEKYCTLEQVQELCDKYDFELGWHTWSHRDLCNLLDEEIRREVTSPFPCKHFAYPYGTFNERVVRIVKEAGYEKAYSVTQGTLDFRVPDYQFKIHRNYVSWT
jgi:peptidoglycan/xylan/chitin deacetylase (PgdA/CDA1 family)